MAVDTPATRDTLGDYPRARLVSPYASAPEWHEAFVEATVTPATPDAAAAAGRGASWVEATDQLLDAYAWVSARRPEPLSSRR